MSSTDSDGLEKVVGIPPEPVVGLVQNEWTASIRIDGRHEPEHAPKIMIILLYVSFLIVL
jgi:hypothetical protein